MKKYAKPQIVAKNLRSGSYAAGCPSFDNGNNCFLFNAPSGGCKHCERTK